MEVHRMTGAEPDPIARVFADFATALTFDRLPPHVVRQAKISVLDTLGVMVRGGTQASTRPVRDIVVEMAGREESTIVGSTTRVPAMNAALVNGTAAHSLELDDHISHRRSL